MFDVVHTLTDYYDGPLHGVADLNGKPHLYEAEWSEDAGAYSETFLLTPIDAETLALALEDWEIWRRWENAFHRGLVELASHPALLNDRPRHEELRALLSRRLVTDASRAVRKRGEFRAREPALPSGPGMRPLEVRWHDPPNQPDQPMLDMPPAPLWQARWSELCPGVINSDTTALAIRALVAELAEVETEEVSLDSRVVEDLGIGGGELDALVDEIAHRYGVDASSYRWYHHTGRAGFNPLWALIPPWWTKAERVPLRVQDLVDSAHSKRWTIVYPDQQLTPRPDVATWIVGIGLLIILVVFLSLILCSR